MQNLEKAIVLAGAYVVILLSGCQTHNACVRQKTTTPGVVIKPGALQITSTMIELRCEITNNTDEDIWIHDTTRDIPDPNGTGYVNAGVFVDDDDRTLIIGSRIGLFYGREIWCDMGVSYTRLRAGQSCQEVVRTDLPIPDYEAEGAGFLRILRQGVDHLTRASFEIGYFAEKDWTSLEANLLGYQKVLRNESSDRIKVYDSSQGELCRAERVAGVVVDGIHLPYQEWLNSDASKAGGAFLSGYRAGGKHP